MSNPQQPSQQTASTSNSRAQLTTTESQTPIGDTATRSLASLQRESLQAFEEQTLLPYIDPSSANTTSGGDEATVSPLVSHLPASSAASAEPSRLASPHSILHRGSIPSHTTSTNPFLGGHLIPSTSTDQFPQTLDLERVSNRSSAASTPTRRHAHGRTVSFRDETSIRVEGAESHNGGSSHGGGATGVRSFVKEALKMSAPSSQSPTTASRNHPFPSPPSVHGSTAQASSSKQALPVTSNVNVKSLPHHHGSIYIDDEDHDGFPQPLTPDHPFATMTATGGFHSNDPTAVGAGGQDDFEPTHHQPEHRDEEGLPRVKRFRMTAVAPVPTSQNAADLTFPIAHPSSSSRLGNALDHTDTQVIALPGGAGLPVRAPPGTFLGSELGATKHNQGIRDVYASQQQQKASGSGQNSQLPRVQRVAGPTRTRTSPKHINERPYHVQDHGGGGGGNAAAGSSRVHRYRDPSMTAARPPARRKRRQDPIFQLPDPYVFPSGHTTSPLPPLINAIRWAISGLGLSSGSSSSSSGSSGETMEGKPAAGGDPSKAEQGAAGVGNGEAIPLQEGPLPPVNVESPQNGTIVRATSPTSPISPISPTKATGVGRRTSRGRYYGPPRRVPPGGVGGQGGRPFSLEHEPDVDYDLIRARLQAIALKDDQHKLDVQRKELEEERLKLERERLDLERQREEVANGVGGGKKTGMSSGGLGLGSIGHRPPPETTSSAPAGTLPTKAGGGVLGTPPPKETPPGGAAGGTVYPPGATLSPPKASPALHPASDPVSPTKRPSPFNIRSVPDFIKDHMNESFDEFKVLTLWQYIGEVFVVQVYRHAMLRLPSLYLNRVDRIYAQASLTSVDVDALVRLGQIAGPDSGPNRILDRVSRGSHDEQEPLMMAYHSNSNSPYIGASINLDDPNELEAGLVQANIDPTQAKDILLKLNRFRHEWEGFIDGLVKEWKTLNVVSALLISALLTVFQIEEAQFQPVTRTAALLSLISAFLSLMFGGMYILRFSTMRTMRKAHKWVQETARSKQTRKVLWNIWVMLSLPVTWLAYSLIFFCISLISFIWTSGNGRHSKPPTDSNTSVIILFPRVLVTVVFFTGFVYFCLVLYTFRKWALPTRDMAPTFGELIRNSTVVASGFATPLRAPRVFNAVSPLMSGSGRRDGFKDLASINMPGATREERMAAMMDQHETRSTHSAPSMLGLDVSPSFGTSPFLIGQTLPPPMTATPPTSIPSTNNLPVPPPGPKELVVPLTTITEASPMTTEDPLMGAEARWAKAREMESGDEVAHSSTFERRDQASALDSMLPAPLQPLSMIRERTEGATSSGSGSGVAGAGSGSRFAVLSNVGGTDSAAAGAGGADGEGEKGKKGWKLFGMGGKGGDGPKSGEVAKEKKSPMGRLNDLLH